MNLRPPRLTVLLAAAIVSAILIGCSSAPPASAARGMEISIQDDSVFVGNGLHQSFNRERAYRLIRPLGVSRLRINVSWANVLFLSQRQSRTRPAVITYDFGLIDNAIDAAARHGVRVYLTLTGQAPAFATANHRVGNYRPNAGLYADFVAHAARHFRGRVKRYSIWNEPNWHTWLSPLRAAPRLYRSLYFRGYQAIKAQDPHAQVLFGETVPYGQSRGRALAPLTFLRRVLCLNRRYHRRGHCPRLKADGYAHHPYDFLHPARFRYPGRNNVTMATLRRLTRALDRASRAGALRRRGGRHMPLYLTEYGYFGSGPRTLPKRRRVRYLKQGWSLALRNRRVKQNLQYLLVGPRPGGVGDFFDLGLLSPKGRRRPTYNALRRWYRSHRHKVRRPPHRISLPPAPPN
ncbi:MAG: hypothetical protein ABR581_09055 [Thermoleophilaceae bacterium]